MPGKKHPPGRRIAPVHAMIEHPIYLRKAILSAAIDATKLLKDIEEYRILKTQKLKAHRQLTRVMRELKTEQKRLENEHLPPLSEMQHERHHEKKPLFPTAEPPKQETILDLPKPAPKKTNSEIDRLNSELHDIEERLKHI